MALSPSRISEEKRKENLQKRRKDRNYLFEKIESKLNDPDFAAKIAEMISKKAHPDQIHDYLGTKNKSGKRAVTVLSGLGNPVAKRIVEHGREFDTEQEKIILARKEIKNRRILAEENGDRKAMIEATKKLLELDDAIRKGDRQKIGTFTK